MNPEYAKLRFRLRPFNNYLIILAIFVPLVYVGTRSPYSWLIDVVLIIVLAFLNFAVLEKRAIKIMCPGCTQTIVSNTPWVCGFCRKNNMSVDDYPLVHRCEHCSAETKAYKCHHRVKDGKKCNRLIFLTKDRLEDNYAICLNTTGEVTVAEESATWEREKKRKEHDILMEEMDGELQALKERKEFIRKKTPREAFEADFEKHHGANMAVKEIAFEKEAFFREKYKNEERLLANALESLEVWKESRKG